MKNLIKWIAVGFGTGWSPIMPGTVGTLVGLPLAWWLMTLPNLWCQIGTALVMTLIAIPICGVAEKVIGGKDPGCIVADE